jgi:hypothetical protein
MKNSVIGLMFFQDKVLTYLTSTSKLERKGRIGLVVRRARVPHRAHGVVSCWMWGRESRGVGAARSAL